MKYEIKNWKTGRIIYSREAASFKAAVEMAVAEKIPLRLANLSEVDLYAANLRGADLYGADLHWADLRKADLREASLGRSYLAGALLEGADLRGAKYGRHKMKGPSPVLQIGPIGSGYRYLIAFNTPRDISIHCGCFRGSITKFEKAVREKHKNNRHAKSYLAAIKFIKAHFKAQEGGE